MVKSLLILRIKKSLNYPFLGKKWQKKEEIG